MNRASLTIEDRIHRRVLQVMLASMLTTKPTLLRQVEEGFASEAALAPADDHDAVLAYGSQFIHGTLFVGTSDASGTLLKSAPDWIRLWLEPELRAVSDGKAHIRFEVRADTRVWQLIRDGRTVSEFPTHEAAVDAAKTAVALISAAGGVADWIDAAV
jgi:hypothetical protein